MNKIIISLLLFLVAEISFAGWSRTTGEVTRVYSHNGAHVIRTTIEDDVCTLGNFWWPADDPDAKDMLSISLAALMSGKKINVVYNPSNLNCA
ncbi:MAG: hypothetical protein OQK78_12210, partial [Gammaproteobacteria bacterium]|nr:hypothetical protein [Gammaproteobacteria bacterium]